MEGLGRRCWMGMGAVVLSGGRGLAGEALRTVLAGVAVAWEDRGMNWGRKQV